LDLYAVTPSAEQTMELDDLLLYLKNIDSYELGPLEAILAQTEAIGDPALPSSEQSAILTWINVAYTHWEEQFPIEEPLASELRKLLPLAAALAITDPNFLTPGAHSLHLLLDTVQTSMVGWQSSLGRAGQGLEQLLGTSVSSARAWFSEDGVDLTAIYAELTTATKKDRGRAQRMAQRVAEAERGRLKTAHSKRLAAQMINEALASYPAPVTIGEFLKGPWYESAQLVILKFGAESEQWTKMSATTEALLDSLQTEPPPPENSTPRGNSPAQARTEVDSSKQHSGSRRQHVFEAITRLPREIKRWLLSLQHDSNGVSEAIGAVEIAHMCVLRQQDLGLTEIEPIEVTNGADQGENPQVAQRIDQMDIGQWFLVTDGENEPIRVQLALKMAPEQQLLFTNHAGIKAMQKKYVDFVALLEKGQATVLHSGPSFSGSLAYAAKIRDQSDMESLNEAAAQHIKESREEAVRIRVEQEEAELQLEVERLRREEQEAELLQKEYEEATRAKQAREEEQAVQDEQDEAARTLLEREQAERMRGEREQVQLEKEAQDKVEKNRYIQPAKEEHSTPMEVLPTTISEEFSTSSRQVVDVVELNLTMGAWLGFHDGDTPLMAKLAVHDREKDNYIFVNREGIKMRDLTTQELVALIDKGMVDILETRSNFKDEITRVRNKQKQ